MNELQVLESLLVEHVVEADVYRSPKTADLLEKVLWEENISTILNKPQDQYMNDEINKRSAAHADWIDSAKAIMPSAGQAIHGAAALGGAALIYKGGKALYNKFKNRNVRPPMNPNQNIQRPPMNPNTQQNG